MHMASSRGSSLNSVGPCCLLLAALLITPLDAALAHTSERAFILLLPTRLYMFGGGLAVAFSFVVMALIPLANLRAIETARWRLGRLPRLRTEGWSLGSLLVVIILVIAGHIGSRDPLANPLPLMVWTVWWVGLTLLHAVFGNLWHGLNPWRGLYRLLTGIPRLRRWREAPPFDYPPWLGYWPAAILFFAFTWYELIYPSPRDPAVLANAIALYLVATLVAMLAFGDRVWLRYGEAFSVFFRMISWLSPLETAPETSRGAGRRLKTLWMRAPGIRLLKVGDLPASGLAFVLLALASVSFDGLSRSFWWLGLVGVNPLEHPGRTAMVGINTLGLLAMFSALAAAYFAAAWLGRAIASPQPGKGGDLGRLVVSIIPIAFGYHAAHYLLVFLVEAQYAIRALSDPFALGWNLFGAGDYHVITSFSSDQRSVTIIWNIQVIIIVVAHVMAVSIAHFLALRGAANLRRALLGQAPMTMLMIAYTLFGLWLLSTPAAG